MLGCKSVLLKNSRYGHLCSRAACVSNGIICFEITVPPIQLDSTLRLQRTSRRLSRQDGYTARARTTNHDDPFV